MGYERNERRYGYSGERDQGGYGADRGRSYGGQSYYGRDDDRARSYGDYGNYGGSGRRDYRGDRYNERGDYGRDDNDRGFFERAGDEVRSWFGDEDAERRRRHDERNDEQRYGRSYGDQSYRGYDRGYERDRGEQGYGSAFGGGSGRGASSEGNRRWDLDRERNAGRQDHDPSYRSWRDRQMESFDRDYDEYRREHQGKFDSEFGSWRQQRQGQRDQLRNVKEHQEVVGSDGQHIGKVDHVRGDRILLAKSDEAAGGRHHSIPCSWIQSVDDKVTVSKTADQAKQHWRDEEREQGNNGLFGNDRTSDDNRGGTNLNRSFSGTY